jgi:hypothetical protein
MVATVQDVRFYRCAVKIVSLKQGLDVDSSFSIFVPLAAPAQREGRGRYELGFEHYS